MALPATLTAWLRLLETRHPVTIDLGLERVGIVWDILGRPKPAPRVITVAGTNGKGSTVAYADAMLRALGFRCGTYTSPHLLRYTERVSIAGAELAESAWLEAFERVEAARGTVSLTYFEFGTLAAFLLLADAKLDFAVLEVGLGGRLDAVNLVDADCAVITPIGLDHQEYLGPDRDSIGLEKAGIIRPGRIVVCGESDPPPTVLTAAARLGAPLRRLTHEFSIAVQTGTMTWRGPEGAVELPVPAMSGAHQCANVATALAAVAALVPAVVREAAAIGAAVANMKVRGRLEVIPGQPRVVLDVGHNPLAALAVAAALRGSAARPVSCVLGMLQDKDAEGVAAALDGVVGRWYCGGLGGQRGRSGEALARAVAAVSGAARVRAYVSIEAALAAALVETRPDRTLLVFGSFHTVAEAARCLAR